MSKKRIATYVAATESRKWGILTLIITIPLMPIAIITNTLIITGKISEKINYLLMDIRWQVIAKIFVLFGWEGVKEVDCD